MQVSKQFIRDLGLIRRGLTPIWNPKLERFQIFYKDDRTGIERILMTVETPDGGYKDPGFDTIIWISQNVDWGTLDKYPNPSQMAQFFMEKRQEQKTKATELRHEYRKWWNKENRKRWKAAMENAQRGILGLPKEEKRKIIV